MEIKKVIKWLCPYGLYTFFQKKKASAETVVAIKYYNSVIPLGANCEPAFQFQRYFGNIDSSLFNWLAVADVSKFIETIENPSLIFIDGVTEHPWKGNMWKCERTKLNLHGVYGSDILLDKNGEYIPEQLEKEMLELIARTKHLVEKLYSIQEANNSQLYIMTLNYFQRGLSITNEDIKKIYTILHDKSANSSILIVADVYTYDDFKSMDNNRDIFVRKILTYAPFSKVTIPGLYDEDGWNKIFYEFKPKTIGEKKKLFKFEKQKFINSL